MVGAANDTARPLVSVLVPAYNHERFVAECIESVLAQTHRPLELVVVDDGSSDSTPLVVESLAADARSRLDGFVFVRQKNHGIPKTLNTALRHARGEFVALLGSDDVQLPTYAERLLGTSAWKDPSTAAVFGDATFIDEQGAQVAVLEDQSTAPPDAPGAETLALAHYLRCRPEPETAPLGSYASILRGMYIPMVTTLLRRSALRAAGDFDERYFLEDYPLLLKLARDHRIAVIPDVVARRRLHGGNASIVEDRVVFREFLELMVRERSHTRSDPVADAARVSLRDRAYLALHERGTTLDLLRVISRYPVAASAEILEARRHS